MTAPLPPILVSPIGGEHADGTTVPFEWEASTGAINYALTVSTAPGGGGTIFHADWVGNVLTHDVGSLPNTGIILYWWVNAVNGSSEYSGDMESGNFINGVVTAPAAPTLSLPVSGEYHHSLSVLLAWEPIENAATYFVDVNTTAEFDGTWVVHDLDTGGQVPYQELFELPDDGTTYYWRVRAHNEAGYSDYSEVWSFINGELPHPVLVSPIDDVNAAGTTLTFTWEASEAAEGYYLQIAADFGGYNLGDDEFEGEFLFSDYVADALTYDVSGFANTGEVYHWRVIAMNGEELGLSPAEGFINGAAQGANKVTIHIDWDADGNFTGTYDDISAHVMNFSFTRGRDAELGRTQAGTCEMLLRNEDGRYSPDNQASPLYGLILPGRKVQAKYTGLSGDVYLFTGFINELRPNPRLDEQNCYVYAVDGMDALSRGAANVALKDNRHSGEIIGDILDDAGWPELARTIDTGEYNHPWASVSGISALEAINQLESLEYGARCFIDGEGNFVWQDSLYRQALTSTLLVDNTNTHIESTFNLSNVLNEITCDFTPDAELQPAQTLYELQNPLPVYPPYIVKKGSPGGWDYPVDRPVTLYCPFQYPCKNATFLWSSLSYWNANTEPDGSGIEVAHWITCDASFTAVGATMIINNTGGW